MGGSVITINSKEEWAQQQSKAKNDNKAVVVDFTATWCGPCKMIGPYYEELSGNYPSLVFLKVDVDAVEAVAAECGITAMPTFQVWKNAEKVDELVGASKEKLKALIEKYQ
ncbi:hypothetical protein WJX72_011064 [[Myrmecia] bisecta]|uniref:Thioredoxin n=1 Tax=[Myrmecia] bisecta TaxID=41462 RepID=A0AAW1PXV0_9CHLO